MLASLISDISIPTYNLTLNFEALKLKDTISAYLTLTVVTFADVDDFVLENHTAREQ